MLQWCRIKLILRLLSEQSQTDANDHLWACTSSCSKPEALDAQVPGKLWELSER